eukprot:Gb_38784 [translate_table: standard]
METPPPGMNRFKLPKESELRIEVGWDVPLRLQLSSGTAEIFGTELPPQFWLTFPPAHKFASKFRGFEIANIVRQLQPILACYWTRLTSPRIDIVSISTRIVGSRLENSQTSNSGSYLDFSCTQIFTWNGATVDVDGNAEAAYVADETPMVSYVNVHAVLERRRIRAKEASMPNPSNPTVLPASQRPEALSESQVSLFIAIFSLDE